MHTRPRGGQFQSYRTSAYKFHFYETLTGYKFILLSDPLADNMQFVLKAIYSGPFLDFVVRNYLIGVKGGGLDESWGITAEKGKIRGRGIDNDRVSDPLSSIWPAKLNYLVSTIVPHSCGSLCEGTHKLWRMIAVSEVACLPADRNGLCNDLRHHLRRTNKKKLRVIFLGYRSQVHHNRTCAYYMRGLATRGKPVAESLFPTFLALGDRQHICLS